MGNSQRNSSKDLGWLGGFVDGEGSIMMLQKSQYNLRSKRGEKYSFFDPAIKISGTEVTGLNHLTEILDSLGLPHHVSWRIPQNATHKKSWMVEAKGVKRCLRWCQVLLDCLVIKKKEAENMLEFCHSRMEMQTKYFTKSAPYTDRQYVLIQSLRGRRKGTRLF